MSVISTGTHPKALWPGVHAWVMGEYNKHATEYTEIFTVEKSSRAYEEDVATSGFGLVKIKAEGAALEYDTQIAGPTTRYTHVAYALGYMVTKEELADNLYLDKAFKRGSYLKFSFTTSKEIVHANVLNRAFSASYAGPDGVSLINTAHTSLAGTWSNQAAVAADLSEASLEDMLTQIGTAVNSRGMPIAIRGMKLVIGPGEAFNAERILGSTMQSGSANNDINAIKSMGLLPGGVVVNHYLTDPDAWFIITDVPNGLMSFQRQGFEFEQDNDFETKNAKFSGYERYSCGFTDQLAIFGNPGA